MKYRRLSNDELKELEKDFVKFLAANTVTADDWVKFKATNPLKVEELIGIYSDIVFDKTLESVEYLEFKTPFDIKTFHCQAEKIVLMGLAVSPDSGVDFTKDIAPQEMMAALKESEQEIQIYTAEKGYNSDRKQELFSMMENGCLISKDGHLYKTLAKLKGK